MTALYAASRGALVEALAIINGSIAEHAADDLADHLIDSGVVKLVEDQP